MKNKKYIALLIAVIVIFAAAFAVFISQKKDSVSINAVSESANENADVSQNKDNSTELYTGDLSIAGDGYEGIKGTGNYNYGEALQKSLLFYELQRSGDLPENVRCNWRGDSCLNDGADNGLDLTGGWFDAGDNVKFNLPMSYTAAILAWSIYEDKSAYEESGQLDYALANIKWANDYFIKCHPEDEVYYYQVGNGSEDHGWWGAAELVETRMTRPSYCVTKDAPGSTVCGETAASLAACSVVYKDIDPEYSELCLSHAKSLFKFANDTKSDDGYTMANGFYTSNSGFYDELSFAATWLYIATGEDDYLKTAEECYKLACQDYIWALCWDDVHIGTAVLLARITGDSLYSQAIEQHLDWWTTGLENGERITYSPKGLAWLDSWGSLRYATTTAFVAAVYSQWDKCPEAKADTYWDFAVSQVDYALGSTGFSYMIGFGDDYPVHPHHRTAQGSYSNNMNEPSSHRHTLIGALVGGPDASDNYTDEVTNYNTNEVACDYNAGFTAVLAKLYSKYHGETIKNLGAVEVPERELFIQAAVNVDGQDFIELKTYVINETAWPARSPKNLELRYYLDLTEVYNQGRTAADIDITTNYVQAGTVNGLICQDEENNIYYLSIVFDDGSLYPGGQENYKKEIQVRLRNPEGAWDNSNDPSYSCLNGNELVDAETFALFEDGKLVYGSEAKAGNGAGSAVKSDKTAMEQSDNNQASTTETVKSGQVKGDGVNVNVTYNSSGGMVNSISGTIDITNSSADSISVKDLTIDYYFTNDEGKNLDFACYHTAINGSSYKGLSSCTGSFSPYAADNADTVCKISYKDNESIAPGDSLTLNFCINYSDWSNMNISNDYSAQSAENIVVSLAGKVLAGKKP